MTFRRLVDDDLPLLHRWLNEPGIVRWWEGDDVSWEGVVHDYGSANPDPVEHWLALVDGQEVGWIQCYAATDEPDESAQWWALGVHQQAAGIDYLVGEPAQRGRGVGSAMIRGFVAEIVFGRHPAWTQACAAPYAANVASWRALARAGFRFAGIVEDDDGPCRLMVADRGDDAGHGSGGDPSTKGPSANAARTDEFLSSAASSPGRVASSPDHEGDHHERPEDRFAAGVAGGTPSLPRQGEGGHAPAGPPERRAP